MNFICAHERRNRFIAQLAKTLPGNTLILYNFVEKHGDVLHDAIKAELGDSRRKLFYLHGKVDAEDREAIRPIVEQEDNAIILASFGVFSTGNNIKRIHNLILASPTKSIIRLLQSIGRGLRKGSDKDELTLYDISDKIVNTKTKRNYTFEHALKRMQIYTSTELEFKLLEVQIE